MGYHRSEEEMMANLKGASEYLDRRWKIDFHLAVKEVISFIVRLKSAHEREIRQLKEQHAQELAEASMREIRLSGT